jgi:integrase|tara:strand:+ start:102 stop:1265 length:1164 start_codon:yes stop_codon:yes gene_type:complete
MGRQKTYKGVKAASESTISVRFAYPDSKTWQREFIKLEPTPANLERCYVHVTQVKRAIKEGNFDYIATFPDSPRALLYTNRRFLYTYLKSNLAKQAHIKSGTRIFYTRIIEGQVKGSSLAKTALADITWPLVRDWALAMDVLPRTRSARLAVIRGAMDDAVEDELIKVNPLLGKKLKKQSVVIQSATTRIDPFSWEERDAIITAAPKQFGLQLAFQFFTGMRPEEVRGLTWDRVDFVGQTCLIDRVITDASVGAFEAPKTQASFRTIELVGPAFKALMSYKQFSFLQGQHVFLNPLTGRPWSTTNKIRAQWVSVLKKAGVRYRVPYQTRHTFASQMMAAGEDHGFIAQQMGHADIGVTLKYYARFIQNSGIKHGSKLEAAYAAFKAK